MRKELKETEKRLADKWIALITLAVRVVTEINKDAQARGFNRG